jgi:hypothetical protein
VPLVSFTCVLSLISICSKQENRYIPNFFSEAFSI